MRLADLTGRRVALLGLGADVTAALPAIRAAGPAALRLVLDDPLAVGPGGDDGDDGEGSLPRSDLATAATWAEVFVRAPGFPRYQDPLQEALGRGARMTTPLDLWLGTHGADRTVVAVTGTKGKSTVTRMIGLLAEAQGIRVGVAGNIGPPVFGSTWDHDAPCVVLEVSSYQAADLHHVPQIAVVPFLAEDHVSWHGDVATYVADKLRVLRNEGGTASTVLVAAASGGAGEAIAALGIPAEVVDAPVADPEIPLQRVRNAALAAAVVARLGGTAPPDDLVLEVARASMPGRLDRCAGPAGLFCVDDALASNPAAAAAALAWLRGLGRPTIVLLGGVDRGVDLTPLVDEAARWEPGSLRVVALPDTGADLARHCGLPALATVAGVEAAVDVALAAADPETAILFSPAAATPPRLGNWETRSAQFRAALAAAPPARGATRS